MLTCMRLKLARHGVAKLEGRVLFAHQALQLALSIAHSGHRGAGLEAARLGCSKQLHQKLQYRRLLSFGRGISPDVLAGCETTVGRSKVCMAARRC